MMYFEIGFRADTKEAIEAILIKMGAATRQRDGTLILGEIQITFEGISIGRWVEPTPVRGVPLGEPTWEPAPGVYANARLWGDLKSTLVADPTGPEDTRTDWQRSRFMNLQNAQQAQRGRTGDEKMPAGVSIDGVRIYPLDSVDSGIATRKNTWQ